MSTKFFHWLWLIACAAPFSACGGEGGTGNENAQALVSINKGGQGSPVLPQSGMACGTDCDVDLVAAGKVADPIAKRDYSIKLTVNGSGTVTSSPSGMACTRNCRSKFAAGTVVTLTPTAAPGYAFNAWSGACAGTGTCSVTMSQERTLTATFAPSEGNDTTQPTVASTSPASGTTGVAVTSPVSATFSEPINCNTVNSDSFAISGLAGVVSCAGSSALFLPNSLMTYNTGYTALLSPAIKDLAGNALSGSRSWSFTTAADSSVETNFTFLAYGDSRAGSSCSANEVHMGLVQRMAAEPAQFVFHLGDMVSGSTSTTNWIQRGSCSLDASRGSFKEIIAPLLNKAPAAGLPTFFFPVVGNHDDNWSSGWYPDRFGHGFCSVFSPHSLLQNHTQHFEYFKDTTDRVTHYSDADFYAKACSTDYANRNVYSKYLYYSFKFKNSVFAALSLNSDYADLMECGQCSGDQSNYADYTNKHQLDWLRYVLSQAHGDATVDNVFVFMHVPLVTASDGHAPNASWPLLLKEFSKYSHKMKIVFSGHNHAYERSYPVFASDAYPNGVRDDLNGTIYAVTGGGGSPLYGVGRENALIAKKNSTYHYMRIDVNGKSVSVKVIGRDGAQIDSFSK